jgi:chromosome segregation ATPase
MPVSLILVFSALLLLLGTFTVVTGRRLRARLADTEARLLAERAEREQVKGQLVEHKHEAEALVEAERTQREGVRGQLGSARSDLDQLKARLAGLEAKLADAARAAGAAAEAAGEEKRALDARLGEAARQATTAASEKRTLTAQLAASRDESDKRGQELARLRPELAEQGARIDKARAEEKARYDRLLAERLAGELAQREQLADEAQRARDEAFREKNAKDSLTFEMRAIRGEMQRLQQKLVDEAAQREQLQQRLDDRERALEHSGARVSSLEAALKSWEPVKPGAPEPQRLSMWWCTDCDQGGLVTNKPHKCPPKKPPVP